MENKYLLAKWLNDELTDEELIAFTSNGHFKQAEMLLTKHLNHVWQGLRRVLNQK